MNPNYVSNMFVQPHKKSRINMPTLPMSETTVSEPVEDLKKPAQPSVDPYTTENKNTTYLSIYL